MSGAPRLYAVYLGGDLVPGRMGEDHEVVFVVASDVEQARQNAKLKWRGHERAHIDAVRELDTIDGFAVRLEPTAAPENPRIDSTYVPAD